MNYQNKFIIILAIIVSSVGYGQELLTKDKATIIALENNYGIKIAKNNLKVAENNADILNSGYLPQVTANAGANYRNNTNEITTHEGIVTESDNAVTKSYNASIGLNYTLFDGLGRAYNFKKLKESHNLSQIEAQSVIENALLQVFSIYYQVALLTENNISILQSLEISKQRLKRSSYAFNFGQNTKLQVLNAEVDVNNDSIRYINSQRLLANSKRDLNLLLGRSINTNFEVDTETIFSLAFDLQSLLQKATDYNVEMQKINKNIEISELDIQINKSNLFPSLSLNSSYGLNESDNDETSFFAKQYSKGLNAGISLSWNLFDGGGTKTRIKNSKIFAANLQVRKELITNELERNVSNALEVYNNALFILSSEEKNVETNNRNFNRTEEQFKLGQVTSIEFRQAQVNLLNAQSNLNQAKYDAKNAELRLLQLSGDLLNTNF